MTAPGESEAALSLRAGDHVCACHFGAGQREQLLLSYVRSCLEAGETCVCLLPPDDVQALADRVAADLGEEATSRLVPHEVPDDAGALGGGPGNGPPRRYVIDLAWIADAAGAELLGDLDGGIDRLVTGRPDAAVCLCDLERVDARAVLHLLSCHPLVRLGRRLVPGPLYADLRSRDLPEPPGQHRLDGVLVLSTLLNFTGDVREISALVAAAIAHLRGWELVGIVLDGQEWHAAGPAGPVGDERHRVQRQLRALGARSGPVTLPDRRWGWAHALGGPDGPLGHVVIAADAEPPVDEQFIVRLLAQQAGAALTAVRAQQRQRSLRCALQEAREELGETIALLDWNTVARERFRQVIVAREGPAGVARALHDMTGHTVAVEDPAGAVLAYAGTDDLGPRPTSQVERRRLLERAERARRPIWDGDRLVVPAYRGEEVVGLLVLAGPVADLGEAELMALEDGAALVAIELDHERELAATELRLGRDLLREMLESMDPEPATARARALGYDVEKSHRLVFVEPRPPADLSAFYRAVRRVASHMQIGSLVVTHGLAVVVLAEKDHAWEDLRRAVLEDPSGGPCRVGVGERHEGLAHLPVALRQARLAVRMQDVLGDDRVIAFDELGIYRMLAEAAEATPVERYVDSWLQPLRPLLDYDDANRSELVATLSHYLELGGRHDATARALHVHRSTLKYRLQRIRHIGGYDLADPETLFHLHLATRAWRTLIGLQR